MSAASTPGPWVVESDNMTGRRNRRTGSRAPTILMVVAELGGMPGLIVNQGPITPRDYANARLIAAAPDLLAALHEARLQIEYLHDKFTPTSSGIAALSHINAAVAKAEGK